MPNLKDISTHGLFKVEYTAGKPATRFFVAAAHDSRQIAVGVFIDGEWTILTRFEVAKPVRTLGALHVIAENYIKGR